MSEMGIRFQLFYWGIITGLAIAVFIIRLAQRDK
jgi:hypothetical protein